MKHFKLIPYHVIVTLLLLAVLLNCSGGGDNEDIGESFELTGTYCLDFSIMGSQMTITKGNIPGQYDIRINDYDGGLRSASGTGNLSDNNLNITGTVSTEAGTANFNLVVEVNESDQSFAGVFNVLGPQNEIIFNSSFRGTKGSCTFELSPGDVQSILGQPLLTSLHVELDKIEKISRYRSAAGHNFVDYSGESCVNLKHYFHTYDEGEEPAQSELPASLDYFAPADGTIVAMGQARPNEDPTDYEIDIRLSANQNVVIRLFHLTPASGIEVGTAVSSGQNVGSAPSAHLDSGDFAVYILTDEGYRHISMFEIMSSPVLDAYIARGVNENWKQDLYYEITDNYPAQITCENGNWGNLRHPESRFELDFFILDN